MSLREFTEDGQTPAPDLLARLEARVHPVRPAVPRLVVGHALRPTEVAFGQARMGRRAGQPEPGADDVRGLASERILLAIMELAGEAPETVPGLLLARLSEKEGRLLTALASRVSQELRGQLPAAPRVCVQTLKSLRLERERAQIQREIDELEQRGPGTGAELDALLRQKVAVLSRIAALDA